MSSEQLDEAELIVRVHKLEQENALLRAELARSAEEKSDLEDSRKALLYMLEDLNASTMQVKAIKEEWELTFDTVTDPIFLHDDQCRVVRANLAFARMAGQPIQACIGQTYMDMFGTGDETYEDCLSSPDGTGPSQTEIALWGRDFLSHTYPVTDASGQLRLCIHMLQDISERKRAEALVLQHQIETETSLEGTIQAITSAVEMRDPYTAGHQRRVAQFARAIGAELGLDAERLKGIHMGALIHDIGKIHIPAEILSKPARLTEIEYLLIKQHPQVGYDILKGIRFPWPVAEIAHQHHERMDGSGYPNGLKGEAICLEARIVAVADIIEAISSHRPYRPSLGMCRAIEELERYAGTFYDPDIVEACLRVVRVGFAFDAT